MTTPIHPNQTTLKAQIQAKRPDQRLRLTVIYLTNEGWSAKKIATTLLLDPSTIHQYLRDYKTQQKTKPQSPPGRTNLLNPQQEQSLIHHLKNTLYRRVQDIVNHIKKQFQISYTIAGMCKWLKVHHFRYKRPHPYPAKLSPEKQARFLEEYEQLKAALKPDEAICFIDGVHPDHQTQSVHGWIYKGDKVGIPTTGKQKRLHFMGSVTMGHTPQTFIRSYERINQDAVMDFLGRLADQYPNHTRLYVILDRAGYHTSKRLKVFIEGQSKIQLVHLPPYSPNLNVIERLWKLMRECVMYNRYYGCFKDFTEAINDFFFKRLPGLGSVLRGRLVDRFEVVCFRFVGVSS